MSQLVDPEWHRDELVLAIELALAYGPVTRDHPKVRTLSQDLKRLGIYPRDAQPDNFRTPDAVAMKVGEFAARDPKWKAGAARGKSKAVADLWAAFGTNLSRVRNEAKTVRARLGPPPSA